MRRTALGTMLTLGLLLAACGSDDRADPQTDDGWEPDDAPLVEVEGTVIVADGAEPQVCAVVRESLPPQCGAGVGIEGLDPDDLDGLDGAGRDGGVLWGAARLTGTFDGERLTLTEAPAAVSGEPAGTSTTGGPIEGAVAEARDAVLDLADERDATVLGYRAVGDALEVTVVDPRGPLAAAVREEFDDGDVRVVIDGWLTHRDE
ncbi:hypothetical protein ER308_13325 [Egibacter rhizosphaerae]|uniref:Uncharacterized protein n=1 Tax=Egibacter rhizosphaerae TaxID=1670831 RepID=A0A411YGX7_9ACTN|nr:hypothetical protein [Egibacter rhizosphaerae]QBI20447.1 hypothetical protein ER308_13325 [Egibacter rhizosphaerae]